MVDRATAGFIAVVAIVGVAFLVVQSGALLDPGPYDRATVTVQDGESGEQLATVHVRIADTSDKRRLGLSNTSSLAADEGMLFVHEQAAVQGYIMPDMDFPLDMLFIAPNGTITTIHHAPTRENGAEAMEPFEGYGQYVLEVNRGWANRTGVTVGDEVEIPDQYG